MADFPRLVMPISMSIPQWYGAAISMGDTGKIGTSSGMKMGRSWIEGYPPLQLNDPLVRSWLAQLNRLWNQGIVFDIAHQTLSTNNGLYGGSPLVHGSNQVGEVLEVRGATFSVTKWCAAGDLIKIPGLLANLVFDVTADADSDVVGHVLIPISPPIFTTANSPADGNAITVAGVKFRAILSDPPNIPETTPSKLLQIMSGFNLRFKEVF